MRGLPLEWSDSLDRPVVDLLVLSDHGVGEAAPLAARQYAPERQDVFRPLHRPAHPAAVQARTDVLDGSLDAARRVHQAALDEVAVRHHLAVVLDVAQRLLDLLPS